MIYFNSRPREGANSNVEKYIAVHMLFQFPPPRGGELLAQNAETSIDLFQFPPPRGGEPISCSIRRRMYYFNSRPREGANRHP